jgi:hypothetical protein
MASFQAGAGGDWQAAQKRLGRHGGAARALQALQAERPLPAGNQPGIIQGFAGRALAGCNAGG